jgi:hypothetical protein
MLRWRTSVVAFAAVRRISGDVDAGSRAFDRARAAILATTALGADFVRTTDGIAAATVLVIGIEVDTVTVTLIKPPRTLDGAAPPIANR